jgi:RNA polymerase sigma-70 factor (ECF subfamily)
VFESMTWPSGSRSSCTTSSATAPPKWPRSPAGALRPAASCRPASSGTSKAWETKDIGALIGILDPEATVTAHGGGPVTAALCPIEGGEQIARFYPGIVGIAPTWQSWSVWSTASPGLVAQLDGVVTVFAFDIAGDRIEHIWAIRNPEKLRPWTTG